MLLRVKVGNTVLSSIAQIQLHVTISKCRLSKQNFSGLTLTNALKMKFSKSNYLKIENQILENIEPMFQI